MDNETVDVQNEAPKKKLSLARVGVVGFKAPILILRKQKPREVIATFNLFVDLPKNLRGAHMSRFAEPLNNGITIPEGEAALEDVAEKLAKELKKKHKYARRCRVEFEAERPFGSTTYKLFGSYDTKTKVKILGVEVYGATACPCAMKMCGGVTHNQRAKLVIKLSLKGDVDAEELVEIGRNSFSTPVESLLKRPQEKEIVLRMHSNPKFVEDVVRDCVSQLKRKFKNQWASVECISFESIHPHNAYAKWEGVL